MATFTDAKAGRALFSVCPTGLLVFNVEDAAKPSRSLLPDRRVPE